METKSSESKDARETPEKQLARKWCSESVSGYSVNQALADCRTSEIVIYTAQPMALWTVIADFRGGTYISQLQSTSARAALLKWAKSLPQLRGSFIGPRTRLKLLTAVRTEDERVVAIQETRNVWYWSPLHLSFVVHLVKTSSG